LSHKEGETVNPVSSLLCDDEKEKKPFSVNSVLAANVAENKKGFLKRLDDRQKEIISEILLKYKKPAPDESPKSNQPKTESPEPKKFGALTMPPGLKLKGRTQRAHLRKPLPFLKYGTKAVQKEEARLEALADANVHVRYRNVHPLERDYLFLQEGVHMRNKFDKSGFDNKVPTMIQFASSDPKFVRIRKAAHRGRQRADALGAKYDKYFAGAFVEIDDYYEDFKYKPYHQRKNFGCEMLENLYCAYRGSRLGDEFKFTREDVINGAPELLPEKFVSDPDKDPALYDKQIAFYHEVLEECDRLFHATPHGFEYVGRIAQAVNNYLIPVEFVEGYGVHHNDPRLKGFKCPVGTNPHRLRHILDV
jgi:hypothetical protein